MKKLLFSTFIFLSVLIGLPAHAAEVISPRSLAGRVVLQSQNNNLAWYIDPVTLKRFELRDAESVTELIRTKGLGISDKDLAKIPAAKGKAGNKKLVNRLKGRILVQNEKEGRAWYLDPVSGLRYPLDVRQGALDLLRSKGSPVKNKMLVKVAMDEKQVIQDPLFNGVAYARFDGTRYSGSYNSNQVLALASLTKLMTALVILDTNPVWDSRITVTEDEINYPKTLVGDDATSEVELSAGDNVAFYDLWVAMLVASSNQAAITLADSTGMSRAEFVAKMNEKAKDLGLAKTIFYDPTGLDFRNVTTAKEMARIAFVAFSRKEITEAGQHKDYTISLVEDFSNKNIKVRDRNYSLQQFGVEASKTGYLVEAQRTVAVKKNGSIIVVMHALSMSKRNSIIEKLLAL